MYQKRTCVSGIPCAHVLFSVRSFSGFTDLFLRRISQPDPGDITVNDQIVICVVYNKSGFASVWFLYMLFFYIVNFYFFTSPLAGIVGGKPSGFLKGSIRKFCSAGFYNYMGTGRFFCVEPPVVSRCKMKSELLILKIIFSNIDVKSIS